MTGKSGGDAQIEFSIRDSGIGMTPQQQENLFTSFTQADSSTTRRFGGTGLGLVISKQIVEQMGGWIRVNSTPDMGSEFSFMVRLKASFAPVQPLRGVSGCLNGLKVLVVDDNPMSRDIIHAILARWDAQADLVSSGPEALSMLESRAKDGRPYDLVLLDWRMPGMDGLETLHEMQENICLDRLPVTVMITAYGIDEALSDRDRRAISAVLRKPVDPQNLLDILHQLFPARAGSSGATPDRISATIPRLLDDLRGQRVLLVEDNAINREIALELLMDAGVQVDCAEDGLQACQKVLRDGAGYAAILMDVQMPQMDGIEATRQIRMTRSAEDLPIIALTAHAYEEERQRCFAAGMNDHICKPVDPRLLVETLQRWLKAPVTPDAGGQVPSATPSAGDLPDELLPFDLPLILRRVNGKPGLARRLIVNFAETYAKVGEELSALLRERRVEDAGRLSHSLKSVAGSLELSKVSDLAARIEAKLAQNELFGVPKLVESLAIEIAPAIAAADGLPPSTSLQPPHAEKPCDPAEASAMFEELCRQIARRSLSARQGFRDYAKATGLSPESCVAHPVMQALDRLDYDTAARLLRAGHPSHDAIAVASA